MRASYRPAFALRRSDLPADAPARSRKGPDVLQIPGLDEDEATMAVAVAQALLGPGPADATARIDVVLGSRTASGWSATFAEALGIPTDRAREVPADEAARLLEPGSKPPSAGAAPLLVIHSDAARPGSRWIEEEGMTSQAVGLLASPDANVSSVQELVRPSVPLTTEAYQAHAKWEREAPLQVPRGAYVPEPTWAHAKPARYRLLAGRCPKGHTRYPLRPACPDCGGKVDAVALPRRGILETFTLIAKGGGPSEFDALQEVHGDYAVGIAVFGPARAPGMMCDTPSARLRIGLSVEPVFRRLFAQDGKWRYGMKLREAAAHEPSVGQKA